MTQRESPVVCRYQVNIDKKTYIIKRKLFLFQHKTKEKHPAYLYLSTLLSLGVLVSATPYEWIAQIYNHNILPEYVIEILTPIQEHVQYYFPSTVMLLTAGAIIHLLECAFMRDLTSLVYMLLWFAVLSLSYFSSPLESYTPMIIVSKESSFTNAIINMLAAIPVRVDHSCISA